VGRIQNFLVLNLVIHLLLGFKMLTVSVLLTKRSVSSLASNSHWTIDPSC